MEAISEDQFKIQHLRQRLAQQTVEYEDKLASAAVHVQVFKQAAEEATARAEALEARFAEFEDDEDPEESSDDEPGLRAAPDPD